MIDPYNTVELPKLNAAAAATTCAGAEPFCTDSNGILLSVDWCRFEGYRDTEAPVGANNKSKDLSCHYTVVYTVSNGQQQPTPVQFLTPNEETHKCALPVGSVPPTTDYDECTTSNVATTSDLAIALHDITLINILRAQLPQPRPPLRVSIGLASGALTPETYLLDAANIKPQAIAYSSTNGPAFSSYTCGLEPTVWTGNYVKAYLRAYDELIRYTASVVGIDNIKLVKITPTTTQTLEYFLPGFYVGRTATADPHIPNIDDVVASCTATPSAAVWNSVYQAAPIAGISVQQAIEQTFGTAVGNLYATMKGAGAITFGLSIPTTNGEALPEIICGISGTGGTGNHCNPQTVSTDQWSTYYLFEHVMDLYPLAGTSPDPVSLAAAKAASLAIGGTTFALAKSNFYVNTTNLTDPAPNCNSPYGPPPDCANLSRANLACDLNEITPSSQYQGVFMLNSTSHAFTGVGTSIGVQTMVGLDKPPADYCTAPVGATNLGDIFDYAINNGSQFIEATGDIANDTDCYTYLQHGLNALPMQTTTSCQY